MSALAAYDAALDGAPLRARARDGSSVLVPVERWLGRITAADRSVLEHAGEPVLDVGCGPGRHVGALAVRGVPALGIDLSERAVTHARARQAAALQADVFAPLPGEGLWQTVLLLDGNVGIGGDPARLVRRCLELVSLDGSILLEVGPPGSRTGPVDLELSAGGRTGRLRWATVGVDALGALAAATGTRVATTWDVDGRWFAGLRR